MTDSVDKNEAVPLPQTVEALFDTTIIGVSQVAFDRFSRDSKGMIQKLSSEQREVGDLIRHSMFRDAITKQNKVIDTSDALNASKLGLEIRSLEAAVNKQANPESKKQVGKELESARFLIAAPFVERARRASFELRAGQETQAEKTLQEALAVALPEEALASPQIISLLADARDQRDELRVKNDLLDQWDTYIEKLSKVTGRKDLRKSDLTPSALTDPQFGALNRFLLKNYDELTKKNWFWSSDGISRSYIQDYIRQRNSKINDFVR